MTKHELPKAYDFKATEPRIYEMWEKRRLLQPVERSRSSRLRPDRQAVRHLHPAART